MDVRFFLKLLNPGFLLKAAFLLLLGSLVIIAEMFVIQVVSTFLGIYFTLAITAILGLLGLVLYFRKTYLIILDINKHASEGECPSRELVALTGTIVSAVLLIIPGFITDFLGLIGIFPVISELYGNILTREKEDNIQKLYEFIRVYG